MPLHAYSYRIVVKSKQSFILSAKIMTVHVGKSIFLAMSYGPPSFEAKHSGNNSLGACAWYRVWPLHYFIASSDPDQGAHGWIDMHISI